MECKECGTKLKEGAQFCGVCGMKVEAPPNMCGKCGGIVSQGAKFCRHCGEVMGSEAAVTIEPANSQAQPARPKKAISKKSQKIMIGVAVIALLLLAMTQLKGMPKASADDYIDLIFFKDYDDNFYAKSSGKEEYILKATAAHEILVSKDGKKIYTLDEYRDLYIQTSKKKPEKIASDVKWARISVLGNTVAFMKAEDSYYDSGILYVKSGEGNAQKVSSEYCDANTVSISEDGKYVAFTEIDGDIRNEDAIRNYLYPVGKEKIRGGKQVSIGVNNKGSILAVNFDQDLYIMEKGKDPDKIISEVGTIIANKDFSKLLVLDQIGNLYECKGDDKEKIEGNVESTSHVKGKVDFDSGMFYHTDTKELDIVFFKNGRRYMKFDGQEAESIASSSISDFRISDDFRNVAYVSDGGLYIKRFNNHELKMDEKIDNRVSQIHMDPTGSHIVYEKEGDLYYLAKGKKEGVKVNAKDAITRFLVKRDGSIYYETWGEDLFLTKGGKVSKKIAKDVSEWYITDQAAYILDNDESLFEVIGKKSPKKINNDVNELVRPIQNNYSLTLY